MDATMSLRVDSELKKNFSDYAKSLGVEPSMLLRRFMDGCLKRPDAIKIDIDEFIFDEIITSTKSIDKLKLLGSKIEKLWL